MKILFYAHSSTLYGANRSLIELILGLKELNPKTELLMVLPHKGLLEAELRKKSIPYVIIEHYNWFYFNPFAERWRKKSRLLFKLWYRKNKWNKRIGNQMNLREHLKFARKFSPDIIYVNSSLNPMGLMVAEKLNIQSIWHHRETLDDDVTGFYLEDLDQFEKFYSETSLHIFPSKFLYADYHNKFGGANSKVIYNSILLNEVYSEKNIHNSRLRFGIVGRINDQKGQKEIINLFETPEIRRLGYELHVIGHGDMEFVKWFKDHSSLNIIFYDYLERNEIYQNFDFLISNARGEAFGRTLAEAQYCGIPVIARSSGAFPELVENNLNGFLYQDIGELEQILKNLENLSDDIYKEMSLICKKHARQKYDYRKIAQEIAKELNILLK